MKQKIFYPILLLVLTLCTSKINAQTEIEINANGRSYSQIFDSLSTGLIPSRIPYGTLYDRVYPWSGLSKWVNGDTTTMSHLFQSWYDAEKSVMNPLARPNNYAAMRSAVQQQLFAIKLPIVAINYQFAYFDSTCVQNGRVSVTNGMLRDNNGASPYLTKQVTIAGIATDSIFANKNYALQYGSPLLLNDTSTTIQNIIVNNVTAGTQYTLTAGVAQTIQFTQAGNNVLRFTVRPSNSNSYITNEVVKVKDINNAGAQSLLSAQNLLSPQSPIGPNCPPTNELLQSDIPFKGYNETQATNSFADYHIYYHTQSPTATDCERVLRKPIIVLDGFDPGNGRQYDFIYKNYLINNDNNAFLGNDLRDKGYDVIILNFPVLGTTIKGVTGVPDLTIPTNVKVNGTTQIINAQGRDGGADYIERNAFLLVKLIQQVNAALAANGVVSKIVVVGPYDLESEPVDPKDISGITEEQIHQATKVFTGEIQQVPPIHSVVKKEGKPAYLLARKGIDLRLEARTITINNFTIEKIEMPIVHFRVACSTRTYIRSLANDYGKELGCGAYLSSLRRTRIGTFLAENALQMEDFADQVKNETLSERQTNS